MYTHTFPRPLIPLSLSFSSLYFTSPSLSPSLSYSLSPLSFPLFPSFSAFLPSFSTFSLPLFPFFLSPSPSSSLSPHSLLTLSSLSPHSLLTLSLLSPHSLLTLFLSPFSLSRLSLFFSPPTFSPYRYCYVLLVAGLSADHLLTFIRM